MQSLPYLSNSSFITRHRSTRSLTTRVTKEQNDPYIPFEAALERVLCTRVDRVGRSVSPKAWL